MITYIGLLSFTEKGVQTIKDTTKRAAAAKEAAKKFGVNIREMLWTMGAYDVVCVLEAEDGRFQSRHGHAGQRSLSFASRVLGRRDGQDPGQAAVAARTQAHLGISTGKENLR
jgi:GYD domain